MSGRVFLSLLKLLCKVTKLVASLACDAAGGRDTVVVLPCVASCHRS